MPSQQMMLRAKLPTHIGAWVVLSTYVVAEFERPHAGHRDACSGFSRHRACQPVAVVSVFALGCGSTVVSISSASAGGLVGLFGFSTIALNLASVSPRLDFQRWILLRFCWVSGGTLNMKKK